jgi:hypothetical protein
MCKLCIVTSESQHNAYYDKTDGRCKACPTNTGARAASLVCSVFGVVVMAYVLWYSYRHDRLWSYCQAKSETWRVTKLFRRIAFIVLLAVRVFERTAVPRFKILVTFYQVIVVLPSVYGTSMPTVYCEPSPSAVSRLPCVC